MEAAANRDDDRTFLKLGQKLNQLLGSTCRNEFAEGCMRQWNLLSRRFWYAYYRRTGEMPETARHHAAVARAIAYGDEITAAMASDALIDHLSKFTRGMIDEEF